MYNAIFGQSIVSNHLLYNKESEPHGSLSVCQDVPVLITQQPPLWQQLSW